MNQDLALSLRGIGKRYRLGEREKYMALRDVLTARLRNPFGRRGSEDTYLWALRDVNLDVKPGEVLGIMGSNGAGKSTLLKILSGVTMPTEGEGTVNGRVGSLLEVGTGFHPELTGRENIFLNGAILGMKRAEILRKFDEILAFAGVEKFVDTAVKHYSSGMYMRLAFAVAAHLEPEILLVDEVLAVGDLEFQKKCLRRMEGLSGEGRTVLLVSHSAHSLQQLCERGLLMKQGTIVMDGPIGEVLDHYLQMNLEEVGEVLFPSPKEAPGDDRVRIRAVRVIQDGHPAATVDLSQAFVIEVDYWNLVGATKRVVNLNLSNHKGTMVISSANIPSASASLDSWYGKPLPAGLFRTRCTIPANLLNVGVYTVDLYVHEGQLGYHGSSAAPEILSFHVVDRTVREDFKQEWGSAIRLPLDWQTDQLE